MHTTPASLFERLRQPHDTDAWPRFVRLYTPLLYYWACRVGLPGQDAADLVQDVFLLLLKKLPSFTYDPQKSFRAWLRAVAVNRWREQQRRRPPPAPHPPDAIERMADPAAEAAFWEIEYRQYVIRRALDLMRAEFQPTTWRACWECVVEGRAAAEVGRELGLSAAAVYTAKSRVLRRLRQELAGLVE